MLRYPWVSVPIPASLRADSFETLVTVDIAFAVQVQGSALRVPVGHGSGCSMLDVPTGKAGGCGGQERGGGGVTAGGRGLA